MVEVFKGVDNKKTYYAVQSFHPDVCAVMKEVARYKKTSVAKIKDFNVRFGVMGYLKDGRKAIWWEGDYRGDPCIVIYR